MYKFKLGATVSLNERQEQDIIDTLNNLKSRHKLGEYTSALYRVAANNPEVAELVRKELEGSLSSRDVFFNNIQSEINGCTESIKNIHEELLKIKSALLYGNRIGLTGKTDNLSISTLAVERHLNKLRKSIYGGITFDEGINKAHTDLNEIALEVFDILEEMLPSEQYTQDMHQTGLMSTIQMQAIQNPSMVDANTNTIIPQNNPDTAKIVVEDQNNSSPVLEVKEIERDKVVDGNLEDSANEPQQEASPDIQGLFALCGIN